MEFFHALGGGARFNKKRFAQDVELFSEMAGLLDELDTLPSGSTSSGGEGIKRRKKSSEVIQKGGNDNGTRLTEAEGDSVPSLVHASQTEIKTYLKSKRIRTYGDDIPAPLTSFPELTTRYTAKPYLTRNLTEGAFTRPTPIQQQAIPVILSGREVMACAPTGSGKTLAFACPILHALGDPQKVGYRAIIVSPTRELAQQIYGVFKALSKGKKFKICMLTKATASTQANNPKLREKFDILITTPLRLVHGIQHSEVDLSGVEYLVLDEADKLLEAGFVEQMDEILAACSNPKLQKMLFSATLPSGVESLASTIMKDPIRVVVGEKNAATDLIEQKLIYVGQEEGKLVGIRQMVQEGFQPPVLIFVQSIDRAKTLFNELIYDGINVDVIHAERTKAQRDNIVESFKAGRIWVLIATELMARGVDFKGVNLVINYDFPQSVQSYIHRIGRTGRAGRKGKAVTFFTKDDAEYLKSVVNVMRESGCTVPEWMLKLKKPSQNARNKMKKRPIARKDISTVSAYDKRKTAHKRSGFSME
ncbi:MAG: P-loop containing nucleoside triphosphate hydrolase protein [Piptocephalis tieghemiana]|nr:MAG: P-loop containing nucleoside triphosphate hydrolase protein [Piptocephalis tieghemiana]